MKINFIGERHNAVNWMLSIITYLFFFAVSLGLIQWIIKIIAPTPKPEPTSLEFMTLTYLGLPFAFWLFVGLGIMFGLAFHGFKIIDARVSKENKSKTYHINK